MNDQEIYELFLLLQSLNELKRSIILVLAHVYPKSVTIKELLKLSGYSETSKYIFKSETLQALKFMELIELKHDFTKSSKLILNSNHSLIMKFSKICQKEGGVMAELLLGRLLNEF
jgi:hypothetical protein